MTLSTENQIFEQISHANKILITLPESLTADAVASGLAFSLFLKKLEKDVSIVCSGKVPEQLQFLPDCRNIAPEISSGKSLVVMVNTSAKKLEELSYQTADDKVSIFLKSKDQPFAPEDVSFAAEKFPVDLIIVLDARSLEDLGKLFEKNADLFFETPKINIDIKAGNEYFGAVNLVDITATSVSEILSGLFEKYEQSLFDEDIATALLTGIIARTNSFQHVQTTPRAFLKASELIALGGRQQEIIKNVFKTKSLPLLKLWGRALARLKINESLQTVYSQISAADIAKAQATDVDLVLVLKELLENVSGYKVVGLVAETEGGVRILAALHAQTEAQKFLDTLVSGQKLKNGLGSQFKLADCFLANVSLNEADEKFSKAAGIAQNL